MIHPFQTDIDMLKLTRAQHRLTILEKMKALVDMTRADWAPFIDRAALGQAIQDQYDILIGETLIDKD